jgi:branched-chain amino acid transport system permease protein
VILNRPRFAQGDLAFSYLAFGVFLVFAVLTWNLRRSTSGLALRAVRDSPAAARTIGLSVVQVKILVSALGAFTAAVGGGFLAMDVLVAQPSSFPTFAGLVWLAVVVTLGVRSVSAAALGGMSFALLPGVLQTYVPVRLGELTPILFGLGAIGVARNPEGAVLQLGRQIRGLISKVLPGGAGPVGALAPAASVARESNNSLTTQASDADTEPRLDAGPSAADDSAAGPPGQPVNLDPSGSMIKAKQ